MHKYAICFSLLEHWRQIGRTGLTLPFLIGASKVVGGESPHTTGDEPDLANLLYSLQSATQNVRIAECTTLRQPVVAIYGNTTMDAAELVRRTKDSSRLYVAETYAHNHDVGSASRTLWSLIGEAVSEANFSFIGGRYNPFSDDDLALIERVSKT